MKAWQYDEYGDVNVLKLTTDVPVPQINDDQVLVKVVAAALNPYDFRRRQGWLKLHASDSPLPIIPGLDVAGIVVKIGSDVESLKEGDEVYGDVMERPIAEPKQFGTLAEYVAVEEKLLALKPKNLEFIQAAALPVAIEKAYEGLERAGFSEGNSILVMNGAGGVGSFVIQQLIMKAWQYDEYGDVNVLKLTTDVPVPQINDDQVLVKVVAAALNPYDFRRRQGWPKLHASDSPLPLLRLEALESLKDGDEVYGDVMERPIAEPKQFGTLAEYVVVEEKLLALKPKNLDFIQAAALPVAVEIAYEGLERAGFSERNSILVMNGASGVGSSVIQQPRLVQENSSCSTLKSLGADVAIDYTKENFEDLPDKYDVVYDCVGQPEKAVKAVNETGVAVSITNLNIPPPGFHFFLTSNGSMLTKLSPYLESGKVKAVVDPKSPFPFEKVNEAFTHLETFRATGKIVIYPIP
ncbi:Alcohol dehydrogenase, C-terminal [Artemisia annua]|uniref:Alcohol dehydrogenase, C-terminal n=1 Tax=Artemisia annua TaxID=35608 RepID=A0A2U1MME3_ARTAN|nr:Alcohol dehydrogenase, C-terminal [Artemisia annua]